MNIKVYEKWIVQYHSGRSKGSWRDVDRSPDEESARQVYLRAVEIRKRGWVRLLHGTRLIELDTGPKK